MYVFDHFLYLPEDLSECVDVVARFSSR